MLKIGSHCLLISISLVIVIISGCAMAPVDISISSKPSEDGKNASNLESSLGQAGYYYMLLNFKMVDDPKMQNRINRIGARLTYYTERPNIKYGYFIIDTKYRNAFSFPDGYIFISNSLVDTLKDDEQIAAVLTHEIAHVTHKHMLQRLERFKNRNLIESVLGSMVF
ncbi:MAG: M48 family metalloprotease, partial [Candidatus Omnitrophota bacterium]